MKYTAKVIKGKDIITATFRSKDAWIGFLAPIVNALAAAGMNVSISDIIEYDNGSVSITMPSENQKGEVVVKSKLKHFAETLLYTFIYFAIILATITVGKWCIR